MLLSISTSVFVSVSSFFPFLRVAVAKPKARPPVALDVGRGHPTARIGAPMPTSSSPPTPSSLRSASTATSSTQSSPQQQQQVQHPHHSQSTSVASAATAALTNGTSPSASSSTGGGGAPPPSRQSEPKDLKYRETTPSAKKKVTGLFSHACTQASAPSDSFTFVRYNSEHVLRPARQFYHIACSFVACPVSPLYLSNVANVNSIRRLQPSQSHTVGEEAETRTSS